MPADSPGWMPSLLQSYPALGNLPDTLSNLVVRHGGFVHRQAGDVLFEPVNFATKYPFILHGVARVLKVGTTSPDTLLYRLPVGEHCLLSASGLLAHWRFAARVIAESETRAVVIPGALFRQLVDKSPEFAHSVHVGVARRLETVMDLVEQATYFRLDQRLASLILACGTPVTESHQELANDLGVSRENVSRVLSDFRERGWLKLGRRRIDILDDEALRTFLEQEHGA
jgi:CRP/FNR family transcriptional regulator